MTGPRSKGCLTCKKRKVKCDESRPLCQRCVNAKIECRGYERIIRFIEEQPRGHRAPASHGTCQLGRRTSCTKTSRHLDIYKPAPSLLPSQLPSSGWKRDISISFLLGRMTLEHSPGKAQLWTTGITGDQSTSACALGLDALATMFFGRSVGDMRLVNEAFRIYGLAIERFRQDLMTSRAWEYESLLSTTILGMYELITFTQANAWPQHAQGLAKLMELRGPDAYRQSPYRELFAHNRVLLISEAIMTRASTFLSGASWKSSPWEESLLSKNDTDYLFDCIASVSSILEDTDKLLCSSLTIDEQIDCHNRLRTRIYERFRELNSWWREWNSTNKFKYHKAATNPDTTVCIDEHGILNEMKLEFENFWTCFLFMAYNAARILLLDTTNELNESALLSSRATIEITPSEQNSSGLLGISNDVGGLSYEILQCIDYCETQSANFIGSFSLLFPFYVAADRFPDDSRELNWFCSACQYTDELPILSGYMTGRRRVGIRRLPGVDGRWDQRAIAGPEIVTC